MHFRCFIHPERPLTAEEIAVYNAGVIVPDVDPATFETRENAANEYLIDRGEQQTTTYTGIKSIVAQDLAVTQDQGGLIADRSREYLVSSDRAIIMLRKRLLAPLKALQQGVEPSEPRARSFAVRPGDFILPRDVTVDEGAREHRLVGAGA